MYTHCIDRHSTASYDAFIIIIIDKMHYILCISFSVYVYLVYEIEIAHSSRVSIKYNFIDICAYINLHHCIVLVSIVDLCRDDISGYK